MNLEEILPKNGPPIDEVSKYIEKYKNELIVIKYGGNVFIDRKIFNNFILDISILNKLGLSIVIVHGGGPRIKRELEKSKIETKFIRGLRVTDKKIQISEMNKWFGDFQVLKNINLEVEKNKKIVVCGPSGSGKSTLIRCINRLEEHQQGSIIVDGNELTEELMEK